MSGQEDSRTYESSGEFSQYVHKATPRFWELYRKLPPRIQTLADKKFKLLKENPSYHSLRLEKLEGYDNYWSVRVTKGYRAVASKEKESFVWFFIGEHDTVYNWLGR